MRLIDADTLIDGRVENDPVRIAAMCAPTAYDVDEVVEQLEDEAEIYCREGGADGEIYLQGAINIVRAGGVNG